MSRDVVIVKWGGSLITDKTEAETPRPEVIARLAQEMTEARAQMPEAVLIGHGSGSFGHRAAADSGLGQVKYLPSGETPTPAKLRGIAVTQHQAARLHRRVVEALLDAGSNPLGWAASSALMARAGKPLQGQVAPLIHGLERGLLPVIYGDVVQDLDWGACICSTESLVSYLVTRLRRAGWRVTRLLWCGETDGIYDRDGVTIPRVDGRNLTAVRRQIAPAAGVDVTGGMLLRLETCRRLAKRGIESWLLNGLTPGALSSALLGEAVGGTRFPAASVRQTVSSTPARQAGGIN